MIDKASWNKNYLKILLLHLVLGFAVFYIKPIATFYSLLILVLGVVSIIKNKDQNNETIFWSSYIVAAEVFIRMSKYAVAHEFGKYVVIIFMFLGMYFKGVSKKGIPFAIFLVLLLPGIILGVTTLSLEIDYRKAIFFNILGPICLAVSAIFMAGKEFTFNDFEKLTRLMIYPLVAMLVYILLYNPTMKEAITGTDSNSFTSGGFGPNQVSTILGLGMFLAFVRLLFFSKNPVLIVINLALLFLFSYRGIITFSRGGVYTGLAMIVILMILLYPFLSLKGRMSINIMTVFLSLFGVVIFAYSVSQSGGMILNRYKGQDALGREKASKFSGREEIAEAEWQSFLENPILGIGVGRGRDIREQESGIAINSHSEPTRMLAEHGAIGIINLMILLFTPLISYLTNRQHIFLIPFLIFWFLTINHAAMRIAAPAFIYALTLLKLTIVEKPALHRE